MELLILAFHVEWDLCAVCPSVSGFFHLVWYCHGSFVLYHMSVFYPSLLWNNIPLYGYTTFYSCIYSLMDIWDVSTFGLFWITLLWTPWTVFCINTRFHFSWVSGRSRLLDYVVTLCLTLWGTIRVFSNAATSFYVSITIYGGCVSLHIFTSTCY